MAVSSEFRPMGIGQILDGAFRIYRQNFLRFLAIVAVIYVPITVLQSLANSGVILPAVFRGEGRDPTVLLARIGVGILEISAQLLATAALVRGVSAAYLGRNVTVGQAYRIVLPKLLSLLAATLIIVVVAIVVGALLVVPLVMARVGSGTGMLVGLGLLVVAIPGLILLLRWLLATEVIVVENVGAFGGLARSYTLVKGNTGKVFLLFLIVGLLSWLVAWASLWLGGLAIRAIQPSSLGAAVALRQTVMTVGQILIAPFSAGAAILLYYDLRIRKEAFDLEMLAQSMGLEGPGGGSPSAEAAGPAQAGPTESMGADADAGPRYPT